MRSLMVTITAALGLAAAASAVEDQVYRWTDRAGQMHFSNVPAPGAEPTGIVSDEDLPVTPHTPEGAPTDTAPQPPVPAQQQSDGAPGGDESESAQASLERRRLERQIKDADQQLRALDAQMAELATVRTQHARGGPVAGGLATNAASFQSDEEKALARQRDSIRDNAAHLRAEHSKLSDQTTAASTP